MKPSKHKMTVLSQIFKLIPRNLIPKLANEFGIDRQSRVFSPTSHVLALVFGQLTHALGLNDICDTLRNHCGLVSKIRDCVPPSRNGLSHANRNRDAGMAEKLFREVLAHLNEISPNFRIQGRRYCALPRRFKRMIHVVDSTTIQLIANCLDWAKTPQAESGGENAFASGFAFLSAEFHSCKNSRDSRFGGSTGALRGNQRR